MDEKRIKDEIDEIRSAGSAESEMDETEIYDILYNGVQDEEELIEDLASDSEEDSMIGGVDENQPTEVLSNDLPDGSPKEAKKTHWRRKKNATWAEFREHIASYYENNPGAKRRAAERAAERSRREYAERMAIKRFAVMQEDIDIYTNISVQDRRTIISYCTKRDREKIVSMDAYIQKRITSLLNPLVPIRLRYAARDFPQSVLRHQGFMYHPKGEERIARWVVPNIPAYFKAGEEARILWEKYPKNLDRVDRYVRYIHVLEERIATRSVEQAIRLMRIGSLTYVEVLKKNPKWFLAIYESHTGEKPNLELNND